MSNRIKDVKILKKQYMLVMSMSLMLIIFFFVAALSWVEWKIHHDAKLELHEQLAKNIEHLEHRGKQKYKFFTRRMSQNPEVIEAIKTGQSEKLHTLLYDEWQLLKERNKFFTGFNVFLADGTVLLNMDTPEDDKTYIEHLQANLEKMRNTPQVKGGYEVCMPAASGYCVMIPVYDSEGTYLGVFQFGFTPFFFLEGIKELTGYESVFFAQKKYEKFFYFDLPTLYFADYSLQAYSDKSVLKSLDRLPDSYQFLDEFDFEEDGREYALIVFDINNFAGEPAAKIAVFQDITKIILHKNVNFTWITSFFFLVILIIVFLFRRYNNRFIQNIIDLQDSYADKMVENDIKLKYNETYLDTIFNTSPNLIITTDGTKIDRANSVMLEFAGYETVDAFNAEHTCIYDLFETGPEYLAPVMEGMNWLEFVLAYHEKSHRVQMKRGSALYTFAVKAQELHLDSDNRCVVIFSDISELKEAYDRERMLKLDMIDNYEKTLLSLVDMVEKRDTYTGGHSQRVAEYSRMLAHELGCPTKDCDLLYRAGILHDIGKMTTPDSVLLKPGRLTDIEYRLIQTHVSVGHEMLIKIPMYHELAKIIRYHHERYDGKGYPKGISGEDIPFLARIMIVADAFDAMTTSRIYKGRKSVPEALEELEELSYVQFHPEVVNAAVKVFSSIDVEQNITQLPQNELEEERFAYFYKDSVTQVYNRSYLDFLLNENITEKKYTFLTLVLLHNFSRYNEKNGWDAGDDMLRKIAEFLAVHYPDATLFRVYGDDFVILHEEYKEVDAKILNGETFIKENGLSITLQGINLLKSPIADFKMVGKITD